MNKPKISEKVEKNTNSINIAEGKLNGSISMSDTDYSISRPRGIRLTGATMPLSIPDGEIVATYL